VINDDVISLDKIIISTGLEYVENVGLNFVILKHYLPSFRHPT